MSLFFYIFAGIGILCSVCSVGIALWVLVAEYITRRDNNVQTTESGEYTNRSGH